MSPSTRLSLTHFWEVAAFLFNGLLFLLIGLTVERGGLLGYASEIGLVFMTMVLARGLTVYGLLGVYQLVSGRALASGWSHVANWGGVRGSIPVALALSLPPGVPQLERLRAITLGAVFLSLLVQGLSIKPLLQRLGLVRRQAEQEAFERAQGQAIAARAALRELTELRERGEISDQLYATLQEHFERLRRENTSALAGMTRGHLAVRRRQLGRVSTRLFTAERAALDEAMRRGLLSEEVWRQLKQEVDARLIEGEEEGWERLWQEERVEVEESDPDEGV